jgi:hypothetical protein
MGLQSIGVISSQRAYTFRTPSEAHWAQRVSGVRRLRGEICVELRRVDTLLLSQSIVTSLSPVLGSLRQPVFLVCVG